MKLLIDTHVALWLATADRRMSSEAEAQLTKADSTVLLSSVVAWEVAVKRSLGKLEAPASLLQELEDKGARRLAITFEHAAEVEHLPWHHRDPFDRLIVAQARVEGAVLVSGDARMTAYGVPILW